MASPLSKFSAISLRSKILLILALVIGTYAIGDYTIKRLTVLEAFHKLERSTAQKTTVRAKKALQDEQQVLGSRATDWAKADGTAEFIEGSRPEFESQRLASGVLDREGLDLLYLCDSKGETLWGEFFHPDSAKDSKSFSLEELPSQGRLADELLSGWRQEDVIRGIIREQNGILSTELGPLMVSTRMVTRSSGSGNSGIVVLGRFVSERLIEEIQSKAGAKNLGVRFHDEARSSQLVRDYVKDFDGTPLISELDDDNLVIYHLVDSGVEDAKLIIEGVVDREITQIGSGTVNSALVSTIAGGLVILLVLIGLLQKTVLSPISALMRNAVKIGADDTADVRFDLDREDEIGVLSREFDHMMEKLAASRAALVDTAREAGKSEIASGILHNVGNVLNSVNVSSSMLAKKAEALATGDLEALNGIIAEHAEDLGKFVAEDPRGKHLPPFLNAVTEQMASGKQEIVGEIQSLSQGIDRIRDLVNSQQEYVSRKEVIESVDLTTVVDKALDVSENVDSFHRGFEIVREYEELPRVLVDRYKTLEILVNLIQNARQSMEEHDSTVHKLIVRVFSPDENHVRIEIEDTGLGIEAEQLSKVFDHGFTTKASGHGFGLHSAANAATEMSGTLTARSEGHGQGATFVLELPTRVMQASGAI